MHQSKKRIDKMRPNYAIYLQHCSSREQEEFEYFRQYQYHPQDGNQNSHPKHADTFSYTYISFFSGAQQQGLTQGGPYGNANDIIS